MEAVAYSGEEDVQVMVPCHPISYYFNRIRGLELSEPYLFFFSREAKEMYRKELRHAYDILYAEVMGTDISEWLKQEVEQWYAFSRDFIGFGDTVAINDDLEAMLRRFNLF